MARDRRIAANLTIAQPIPKTGEAVKSAVRVLELLELFQEVQRPLSIAEMSASLGYPYSSTAALTKTMAQEGHLREVGRPRRYMPTLRVAALGLWVDHYHGQGGSVLTAMQSLHDGTGHTVVLHGRNGIYSQFLHLIENPARALEWHVRTGFVRPLSACASGLVYLGTQPDGKIARIAHRCNAEATIPEDRVSPVTLMEEIAQIRRDGHIFAENAGVRGAVYIGVAVPSRDQQDSLVIGFGGLAEEMRARRAEYVSLLREAAASLQ